MRPVTQPSEHVMFSRFGFGFLPVRQIRQEIIPSRLGSDVRDAMVQGPDLDGSIQIAKINYDAQSRGLARITRPEPELW